MSTPFGAPDAGTEPTPRPPFELTALTAYAQLAEGEDPNARIIVGRMGAGKTRCLVELRDRLRAQGGCDVAPIEFDLPSLVQVTRLADELDTKPVQRAEIWAQIWECAIISAAQARVGTDVDDVRSIYAEFGRILSDYGTLPQLRRMLDDAVWDERRRALELELRDRERPLCFFLDAVEENSAHAPLYWLWCQKGLVMEILRIGMNDVLRDKLRVFVAIRDQTFDEIKRRSPAKVALDPQVRVLKWDAPLIADFLARKVNRLTDEYVLGELAAIERAATATDVKPAERAERAVTAWLGTAEVQNGTGTKPEPVSRYILRHTRLIPRDIVMVGKFLADATRTARRLELARLPDLQICEAVTESARLSAEEELQGCGFEVISRQLANSRSSIERREIAPDEDAATRVTETLVRLLAQCERDVVPRARVAELDAEAREQFGPVEMTTLLWRHGLVGWGDNPEGPFTFSLSRRSNNQPVARFAAMHPVLIDLVGVVPATEVPVVPFDVSDAS